MCVYVHVCACVCARIFVFVRVAQVITAVAGILKDSGYFHVSCSRVLKSRVLSTVRVRVEREGVPFKCEVITFMQIVLVLSACAEREGVLFT